MAEDARLSGRQRFANDLDAGELLNAAQGRREVASVNEWNERHFATLENGNSDGHQAWRVGFWRGLKECALADAEFFENEANRKKARGEQ